MRTTEIRPLERHLTPQIATLLEELGEECQTILKYWLNWRSPAFKRSKWRIYWES